VERGRDPRLREGELQADRPGRDAILAHGRRWDEAYMDALASELEGSVLAGRLPTAE
jgi:hypothetical protein